MFEKLTTDPELLELLRSSKAKVDAMTPDERAAMIEAQRQSFARSMAPCEHGISDWEDCLDCRNAALASELMTWVNNLP